MRRLDVVFMGLALLGSGAAVYGVFRGTGLNELDAGVWSQLVLIGGVLLWTATYLYRAVTQNMTYNQQVKDYEEAVLQKRFESLSPEERAVLEAEVEAERAKLEQTGGQSP